MEQNVPNINRVPTAPMSLESGCVKPVTLIALSNWETKDCKTYWGQCFKKCKNWCLVFVFLHQFNFYYMVILVFLESLWNSASDSDNNVLKILN